MKRPQSQITNAAGQRQIRAIFEPLGWAVREIPQDTDVGIDFEVEVFENFVSTGETFKLQLKSSGRSKYSNKRNTLRQGIKRKHLAYYCKQITQPVIILHADVNSGRTFWFAPQLENFPSSWVNESAGERKVQLNIPLSNELPQTTDQLVRTIGRVKLVLGTRAVLEAPVPMFLRYVKEQVDEDALIRELRDKSDAVRLSQLQQMYLDREFDEAKKRIAKILQDADCSIENRFWALLEEERIDWRLAAESGAPQGSLFEICLRSAKQRQQLAKCGPSPLKFAALIDRQAAELNILCSNAAGLAMNYQNLVFHKSMYWALQAFADRLVIERQVLRKFNQCIRLASYASNSRHRFATARSLCRIPQAIPFYLISLDMDGRNDAAKQFSLSAFEISKLAAWIARRYDDDDTVKIAASTAIPLAKSAGEECITWAKETVGQIQDDASRADGLALIDRQIQRSRGEKLPDDLWKEATTEQIYTNMAMSMGIDMADPNDPVAKLVRIGIADDDPARVFRTCDSIFVSIGPLTVIESYLFERLGAPVGPKVIHCERHRYGVIGRALDEAYSQFDKDYCSRCPDRKPRSPDWKYSRPWHEKEGVRLAALIRGFRGRATTP